MSAIGNSSHSITRTLLLLVGLPLAILVLISAIVSALMTNRSVDRLYDQKMQSTAEVLLSFILYDTKEIEDDDEEDEEDESDNDEDVNDEEEEEDLNEELLEVVAAIEGDRGLPVNFRLGLNGQTLFMSANISRFPICEDGHSRVENPQDNNSDWFCYKQNQALLGADLNVTVEVFEPASQRQRDVRTLVMSTFAPLFLLPVLVLLFTAWAVSRSMRPLKNVSSEVAARSVNNLERLPVEDQPSELIPVVSSVNGLLQGIERGITREKQFTDDAAHELRTPLTSIKMMEQLLRRDNKDPELNGYLDNLRDSVDQSNELIEQMLGFARLQSVKSLQMDPVNVNHSLSTQLGLLSPQMTSKNISVEFNNGGDEDVFIHANEAAINVLMNNLLTNSIKFSNDGGVVYLAINKERLRIEDDGPGIEPEDREKIFDRFYRASSAHGTKGSGLGLAFAKWVADAHQFELAVETPRHGSGAAFVLRYASAYLYTKPARTN